MAVPIILPSRPGVSADLDAALFGPEADRTTPIIRRQGQRPLRSMFAYFYYFGFHFFFDYFGQIEPNLSHRCERRTRSVVGIFTASIKHSDAKRLHTCDLLLSMATQSRPVTTRGDSNSST